MKTLHGKLRPLRPGSLALAAAIIVCGCYQSNDTNDTVEFKLEVYGLAMKAADGTSQVVVEEFWLMKDEGEEDFLPVMRTVPIMVMFGRKSSILFFAAYTLVFDLFSDPGPYLSVPSSVRINDRFLYQDRLSLLLTDGGEGLADRPDGKVMIDCIDYFSEVKMPQSLTLLSPMDGDRYSEADTIAVRWAPAADADFYYAAAFSMSSPDGVAEAVVRGPSASEGSFELSAGSWSIVVLAVNGFSPGSEDPVLILDELDASPSNVSGVEEGMFFAASASAIALIDVE